RLCVGDAMIHPLWPTVDIQQTGVTVPTQVPATASAASDYADWFDACNPANIPVEGGGSRTEFVLTATVDPLFAQAPPYSGAAWNWTAKMPAVSGLEYWSASQNGSAWQPQPTAPGSTYTDDVFASTDPNSPPAADPFSVTFEACAPPGPGDAAVYYTTPVSGQGITANVGFSLPKTFTGDDGITRKPDWNVARFPDDKPSDVVNASFFVLTASKITDAQSPTDTLNRVCWVQFYYETATVAIVDAAGKTTTQLADWVSSPPDAGRRHSPLHDRPGKPELVPRQRQQRLGQLRARNVGAEDGAGCGT
ncbi:MAG: hypothetical protein ABSG86_29220, partial [Thermoguttaceae bacterium]